MGTGGDRGVTVSGRREGDRETEVQEWRDSESQVIDLLGRLDQTGREGKDCLRDNKVNEKTVSGVICVPQTARISAGPAGAWYGISEEAGAGMLMIRMPHPSSSLS